MEPPSPSLTPCIGLYILELFGFPHPFLRRKAKFQVARYVFYNFSVKRDCSELEGTDLQRIYLAVVTVDIFST